MPGPVLCALEVEPWLETAPRTSSYVKPDGSIVSRPLEDLWPFLDRKEFHDSFFNLPKFKSKYGFSIDLNDTVI